MPNWTFNEIVFPDKDTFNKYVVNGNFDFNNIIPMPKELKRTISGGRIDECIDLYNLSNMKLDEFKKKHKSYSITINSRTTKKEIKGKLLRLIGDNPVMFNDEEHYYPREEGKLGLLRIPEDYGHTGYEIGEYYVSLIKKYGYYNWYDWSIANWGTKWNACDVDITEDCLSIQFDTAWSCPEGIFKKICKDNPDKKIKFYCDYEDGGSLTYYNSDGVLILE